MLLAHYRLDGNANDSSGNGYNGTATNITYSTGKIGQASSFNGTSSYFYHSNPLIVSSRNYFSVSFWMYPTVANNPKILCPAGSGADQFISYGNTYISINIAETADTNIRTLSTAIGSVPLNTWTHIAVTMNDLNIKIYINGVLGLDSTQIIPIEAWTNLWYWGTRSAMGTGYYTGLLDDIKIYNHILSQKEVKELSKALVLKYDFDSFQEPTENKTNDPLIKNSAIPTSTIAGTWGNWTFSTWSGFTHEMVLAEYSTGNAIKITANSSVGGEDFWDNGWRDNTAVSTQYTFSFYAKGSGSVSINCHWSGALLTITLTPILTRYTVTSTKSTTASHYFYINCVGLGTTGWLHAEGFQVEQKDHATPFVNGSRTGIVRDISGYGNDAILALATTPQWVSSGNKLGKGSYYFDGTSAGRQIELSQPLGSLLSNTFTVSMWCYFMEDGRGILFGDYNKPNTNQFNIEQYTSKSIRFYWAGAPDAVSSSNVITLNTWQMVTVVRNTTDISLYIDGVFKQVLYSGAITDKIGTSLMSIGRDSRTDSTVFQGNIDDVRIYATALSATDIAELYQNRAQIDNNGNFFEYLLDEPPVTDGLVGWWKMDGDATDSSGYENHGAVTGATLTTGIGGVANTAYSFDGVDDVIITNLTQSSLGQEFSTSAWLYPTSNSNYRAYLGGHIGGYQGLFNQFVGGVSHAGFGNGTTWVVGNDITLPLNQWSHVVTIIKAGSGGYIRRYLNGVIQGSDVAVSTSFSPYGSIRIGKDYDSSDRFWQGGLDDIRIYNKTLSQSEITLLYKLGLGYIA